MTDMMPKLRSMKIHIPIHAPDCLGGRRIGQEKKSNLQKGQPGQGDQSINRKRYKRGLCV